MTNIAEQLPPSPWHEGERAMQRSAGSAEKLAARGHLLLRDHLIDQHRQFYPLLPFIVAGAVDRQGDAWATILAGAPGFLQAPDPHRLTIAAGRDPQDPADGGMNDGDAGLWWLPVADTNGKKMTRGSVERNSRNTPQGLMNVATFTANVSYGFTDSFDVYAG